MKRFVIPFLLYGIPYILSAQDKYPRNEAIDIRHYRFALELNDSTDRIAGETQIDIRFRKPVSEFELDLTTPNSAGKGMKVESVTLNGSPLSFEQKNDRLAVRGNSFVDGQDAKITVRYAGIPLDGLIIGKNKFGDRGFFGDNWPNRAHHWLPVIDHPYEKATCEFIVTAPDHYTVIGTGIRMEESMIDRNRKLTHWKTGVAIPTKVMVVGVARFAVEYLGKVSDVPLESWVYPQNRKEGFADYAIAAKPLAYFIDQVGPYPFEKLANVQSKTKFGGMENAGNIFYFENSVTGKGNIEGLVAHEVAHQWFGDSASEADWFHVWLSEGFATYYAHLYAEHAYGSQRLADDMRADRESVLKFDVKRPEPIVNPAITELTTILSTHTYQKASWFLHMLRNRVGDNVFREGVRAYYKKFQTGNALTDDFRAVMEQTSGQDLKSFFDQWLFRAGHPRLSMSWTYDAIKKEVVINLQQHQEKPYVLDVELQVGPDKIERLALTTSKQQFRIPSPSRPTQVVIDPQTRLLYEEVSR